MLVNGMVNMQVSWLLILSRAASLTRHDPTVWVKVDRLGESTSHLIPTHCKSMASEGLRYLAAMSAVTVVGVLTDFVANFEKEGKSR